MKLRIKKIVLGICLALALVVNSGGVLMANAATCWDVRDYGYHRYSQRTYVYDQGEADYLVYTSPIVDHGVIVAYANTYYYGRLYLRLDICVCGLGRSNYYFVVQGQRTKVE